jgi:hypothetical protein
MTSKPTLMYPKRNRSITDPRTLEVSTSQAILEEAFQLTLIKTENLSLMKLQVPQTVKVPANIMQFPEVNQ